MGSLGSDTGGSIRGPASLCGIVGLKPTYGRVSRFGVVPLSWSLDHCGPMTWSVQDTALMLQAIAGYDPKDAASSKAPVPDYSRALREDVKGIVVGLPRRYFFDPDHVHPETLAAVENAVKVLQDLGARAKPVDIPSLDYMAGAWNCITMAEAYALITPTSPQPAERFDTFDPLTPLRRSFTRLFNFTGMPAISICCGFTSRGLPIGLQIAGRSFDEPAVLRMAYTYERNTAWHQKRPQL